MIEKLRQELYQLKNHPEGGRPYPMNFGEGIKNEKYQEAIIDLKEKVVEADKDLDEFIE